MLALLAFLAGCFNEEITMTAYLETDGSVTLQVRWENVYSTEKDAAKRVKEEKALLQKLLDNRDIPMVQHFYDLGADDVTVIVLRDSVPYSYVITGRFDSLDDFLNIMGNGEPGNFDVEAKLTGAKRYVAIRPAVTFTDYRGEEKKDKTEQVRLIIADALIEKAEGLRRIGDNGVILTDADLRHPVRVTWTMRPAPKPDAD